MSRHSIYTVLIIPFVLVPACLAQPVVRILEPMAQTATSSATVSVKGVAAGGAAIVNIYWTDHQGHTGPAQWTAPGDGSSSPIAFSGEIPVRPGANRIALIAVDSRNQSGSAQLAVYSEAHGGPPVSEI